ncbi:alpha/beta hydrolase [Pseudomonas quasicaspiana]|uniref:alpha/beta hydrolase n=1 Tax=Pseudomonas quasicaspiana TaxID=2829821 RepID=UPI001E63B710|nr:alpha/beta hydrolase [Pseudomonas quasicaspiana]MCD5978420.1 alpha/beta hydrolase [Pseudomonas quasicaspiana]
MDTARLLDPSYEFFLDEPSSEWTLDSLPAIRNRVSSGYKPTSTARCDQRWATDTEGLRIRLCIYRPDATVANEKILPAILYIHGGGFVLGRPEMADDYLANLANTLKTVVVAPDYRLAPEHSFPAPLEDCYTALKWLFSEASSLGVSESRLVIMGHSAGGGLAAALALLMRDRGQYQAAGLMMIYPMLDHRTGSSAAPSDNPTTGTLSWSREANRFCWDCMQGSYTLDDDQAHLFSPSLASDLQGLPPSFISVGSLDLFLEEDVAFALALSRSGVQTEMHVYPGVPHMFDQYPGAITRQCERDVETALRKMLAL